jgi:septal ring factor EnvC (AmiA/AmiB activator)
MIKKNVTYEQVICACQILIQQGKPVTARAVLTETGGSLTTIVKHLRRYRREQISIASRSIDRKLLPKMRDAIAVLSEYEPQVALLQQQLADLQQLLHKTEQEKKQLLSALNKASDKIAQLTKRRLNCSSEPATQR